MQLVYSQYRNGSAFFSMNTPHRGHFPGSFQALTRCANDTGHRTLKSFHLNSLIPIGGRQRRTDSKAGGASAVLPEQNRCSSEGILSPTSGTLSRTTESKTVRQSRQTAVWTAN